MPGAEWDRVFAMPNFWTSYAFETQWCELDEDGKEMLASDYRAAFPPIPLLDLPLPAGYSLTIDFGRDATVAIRQAQLPGAVEIGIVWGHFALPALRWDEVFLLEDQFRRHWRGGFSFRYLPLLLNRLAYLTEQDDAVVISAKFWADWRRAVVFTESQLDFYAGVEPGSVLRPLRGVQWERHPEYGWVCQGGFAARDPDTRNNGSRAEYFSAIERFFVAVRTGSAEPLNGL
jgi:hypothetical protein